MTALEEGPEFPPRLDTFAKRLRFVRLCVGGYTKAEHMAKRCEFKPSTYATWEADTDPPRLPHDIVGVAKRINEEFPTVPVNWLLRGGEVTLLPYPDLVSVVGHTERLPFKLPPASVDVDLVSVELTEAPEQRVGHEPTHRDTSRVVRAS